MRDQRVEGKLTNAARQALDEIVHEYREQVLLGAKESAASLGELREISVHDVVAGLSRQQSRLSGPFPTSMERVMSLYVWSGLVIGIAGLAFLLFREVMRGASPDQQLPLLIALSGFVMAGLGYFTLRARKSRALRLALRRPVLDPPTPDYVASLAFQWRDLELTIRNITAQRLGESAASAPLSRLIDMATVDQILTLEDGRRLREILDLRNRVLHGGIEPSQEQVQAASRDGQRLIRKLEGASSAA